MESEDFILFHALFEAIIALVARCACNIIRDYRNLFISLEAQEFLDDSSLRVASSLFHLANFIAILLALRIELSIGWMMMLSWSIKWLLILFWLIGTACHILGVKCKSWPWMLLITYCIFTLALVHFIIVVRYTKLLMATSQRAASQGSAFQGPVANASGY